MSTSPSPAELMLAKSPEEIEVLIGEALLADDFGAKDASDAERRAVARRWFEANLGAFRMLVCGSAALRAVFGAGKKDRNALLGALADVLGSQYGMTVPVTALSAMIIHYGLDKLCPTLAPGES